jgi:hypothetical protein
MQRFTTGIYVLADTATHPLSRGIRDDYDDRYLLCAEYRMFVQDTSYFGTRSSLERLPFVPYLQSLRSEVDRTVGEHPLLTMRDEVILRRL